MDVLSVVCARTGSKGLKNKCIAKIGSKMVVEYAIDFSLSLGKNVKTVVSTDIDQLAGYCQEKSIPVIWRDPNLCTDESKIEDVLANALELEGQDCQYCNLIYGNIPTRYVQIFHDALHFLEAHQDYDAVISMHNVEKYNPAWMFDLDVNKLPRIKAISHRRQGLPQKMIHDGHTLLFRTRGFYERYHNLMAYDSDYLYSIFGANIKPLLTDKLIVDIDVERDLRLAEAVLIIVGEIAS